MQTLHHVVNVDMQGLPDPDPQITNALCTTKVSLENFDD